MCGRFNLFTSVEMIMDDLNVEEVLFEPPPRYNIAPAQTVGAVHQGKARVFEGFKWGLIPHWAKERGQGMINARSETLLEKPSFRKRALEGRCVLPADGFFEWDEKAGRKMPYYFRSPAGRPFYLGGIWDQWTGPDGELQKTCAIITVPSRSPVSSIHDRMPLMFDSVSALDFIDPEHRSPDEVAPLLVGRGVELESFRVGADVNSTGADGSHLIEPVREWF